jgi:hypothetical protein
MGAAIIMPKEYHTFGMVLFVIGLAGFLLSLAYMAIKQMGWRLQWPIARVSTFQANPDAFDLGWWKQQEGRALDRNEYADRFDQLLRAGVHMQRKIIFQVRKKNGDTILGSSTGTGTGQHGYNFGFITVDGTHANALLSEVVEIIVKTVKA